MSFVDVLLDLLLVLKQLIWAVNKCIFNILSYGQD